MVLDGVKIIRELVSQGVGVCHESDRGCVSGEVIRRCRSVEGLSRRRQTRGTRGRREEC